ncbi:MAG: hypothetical protein ACHQ4G_03205, partial [Opitutales bacterium]
AWTAPADWRPKTGSSIRKGSYDVGPAGGTVADCAITAFPGDVGGDLANVNRWLGQLQQAPVDAGALGQILQPLDVNGLAIRVVDLSGGPAGASQRMLGAIVPFENSTWFFKLVGPDAVVAAQKDAFMGLVRSIHPAGAAAATPVAAVPAPAPDMANTAVRTAGGPGLQWSAPADWQSVPATAMRKATYRVKAADGTAAELSISAFPGDVGGELANVNRWRGQLQLAPVVEADLAGAVTRLDVGGLALTVVDCTGGASGSPERLLGAIVPFDGSTWFFKFTGPPALIEHEKPAFLTFLHSLRRP